MPIPAERQILLDVLHDKIKNGKYLLWVAQKEGSFYKDIKEGGKKLPWGWSLGREEDLP